MTIQDSYTVPTRLAQDSWTRVTETWADGFARGLDRFRVPAPAVPFDPTTVVTQWFDAVQQVLEANRTYVKTLAGVATSLDGALREQTATSMQAARQQLASVVDTTEAQVDELDRTAREQVNAVDEVQQQVRREAEAAERAAAREARAKARQRYEGVRKSELVDELDQRGLPKTGNVDELVARLVEDDTK
jgi:hypothetical protein